MNRQLLALTAALVASVAVALPSSTAMTSATVTTKQAVLRGGNVAPRAVPEQRISRLIVKLRAPSATELARPLSAARVQALSATAGVNMKSVREMATGGSLLALDTPLPLSEARAVAARLQSDATVEYAVPDVMYKKLQVLPTDPFFSTLQWNLFAPTSNYTGALTGGSTKSAVATGAANLPPAWVTTTGVPAVVIAVIDTSIVNHPDLNNAGVFSGQYVPTVSLSRRL